MRRLHLALLSAVVCCFTWPGPVSAQTTDALKCYKVKDPVQLKGPKPAWLDLTSRQFGSEHCSIAGQFRLFCVPVTADVTAPIQRRINPPEREYQDFTPAPVAGEALAEDKVCYQIKCEDSAPAPPNPSVAVSDEFGDRTVTKLTPYLLCGPAPNPCETGLCFVEPYSTDGSALPNPSSAPVAFATDVSSVDLGIVMDTTFGMGGEMGALQSSLGTVIDSLKAKVADLGVGIAGHDDFPTGRLVTPTAGGGCPSGFTYDQFTNLCDPNAHDYGNCDNSAVSASLPASDDPYYSLISVTTDETSAVNAAAGLRIANGDDLPEDQVAALFYASTGTAETWPAINMCPAGSRPAVADTATNFGAIGFRKNALPILMEISDAEFHNGVHVGASSSLIPPTTSSCCIYNPAAATCVGSFAYSPERSYTMTEPTISGLATALTTRGVRFIGGAADDSRAVQCGTTKYTSGPSSGVTGTSAARNSNYALGAYGDMAYLADQTASLVPPNAFTHNANCPDGQCCTGFGGAGVPPDGPGGTCRVVFNVNHDGTGLDQQIIDAVGALLSSVTFDVHVKVTAAAGEAHDAVDSFVDAVQPLPAGGTDAKTGATCVTFTNALADKYHTAKAVAGSGDVAETITGATAGPVYCFELTAKPNTTVPATSGKQIFHATLRVYADNGSSQIALGADRPVAFIVPAMN